MIRELRGDFLPDGSHPLVSALKAAYRAEYGFLPGDVPFGGVGSLSDPGPIPRPEPATTMHVADLDAALIVNRQHWWKSAASVAVHYNTDNPVAAAAVNGKWSSGATGACKTDATGHCTFPHQSFAKKEYASVTFSVTQISHSSLTTPRLTIVIPAAPATVLQSQSCGPSWTIFRLDGAAAHGPLPSRPPTDGTLGRSGGERAGAR